MSFAAAIRCCRRRLAGDAQRAPWSAERHRAGFAQARVLIAAFYAIHLYFVFDLLHGWPDYVARQGIEPLWPVVWVPWLGIAPAAHLLMAAMLIGGLAAAFLPQRRWARGLAFASFFLFRAYAGSVGKIDHNWHAWLAALFCLLFAPGGATTALAASRAARQQTLNAVWSALAVQFLFYSMAGAWKLLAVPLQWWRGEVHALAPEALALHIGHRLAQTGSESWLGEFFVAWPWLGWLPFTATLYLQTAALVAAFRPSQHRLFAFGLIGFHITVYLTLSVSCGPTIVLLGLFGLCSPFTRGDPGSGPARVLRELPLLGRVWRSLAPSPATTAPAGAH